MTALLLGAILAGVVLAAGVDGKWTAKMPGRDGQTRDVTYTFKADGDKLTGSMSGRQGNEIPITDGTVSGDKISFKIKMEFNNNSIVQNYTGTVSGDEIKFTVKREGGDQSREVTAKRAK